MVFLKAVLNNSMDKVQWRIPMQCTLVKDTSSRGHTRQGVYLDDPRFYVRRAVHFYKSIDTGIAFYIQQARYAC